MNWQIREILRQRRAGEQGAIPPGSGGTVSVCLVYPNRYYTAMSSLGFQTVYRLFNDQPGLVCERAFLPDREELASYRKSGETLVSLESERPLSDFDIIAFSVSFEPDFINIPTIMQLSRIPLLASDRDESHPLLLAGGAAFFINPEPVAEIFDLIAIGEGEPIIPMIGKFLISNPGLPKAKLLEAAVSIPGVYIPSLPVNINPVKRICADHDSAPSRSVILTNDTEFGNMYMVEVSRGCPRGCRFCAAGFIYQPFRQQPLERLKEACIEGLKHRKTIGLVGAAVSDHQHIEELCEYILANGGTPSLSSLRIDRLTPRMLEMLAISGHRTVSLAPEGASQKMRGMIRKNLTAEQILNAVEMVARAGILNLRLYFIIGLPGETDEDLDEMLGLVDSIQKTVVEHARAHKRLGEITLSVNPFIPKAFTPLQRYGICPLSELKKKVALLERRLRQVPNVRLKVEELHGCILQALLSRGGRELTPLIAMMSEGLNLRKAAKLSGIDVDSTVTAKLPINSQTHWNRIDTYDIKRLDSEFISAMEVLGEKP